MSLLGIQDNTLRPSGRELEDRLLGALGMPHLNRKERPDRRAPSQGLSSGDLASLNLLVIELQREAISIGSIPPNYPLHVDLIMRAVSVLLPWYTRPLREHCQKTSRAIASLVEVINHLV